MSVSTTMPSSNVTNIETSSPKAPTKRYESAFGKLFVSGGVTIVFEACAGGHYLEMLKILKQTTNDPYMEITRRMTASKGIVGVLDGFMPWGMLQSAIKGASFGFGQAGARKMLQYIPDDYMSSWQKDILSGGMGGFVQGVAMSPTLLLKTRVMTDPRFRTTGGFWSTSLHSLKLGKELILTEGGLMSLTKGMGVFAGKRFADWTTRYGFVVLVEQFVKDEPNQKLTFLQQTFCSLMGGTLSALATVPIDVMVATIQQAAKKGEKVSVVEIYKEQFRTGGVMGTVRLGTRGLIPRVAHVALTVLMMKNVSSWCYSFISNSLNH